MKHYKSFKQLIQTQWVEVIKGPCIAVIAYTVSSISNNNFSFLWAAMLFFGMIGLLLVALFITHKIIELNRNKLETKNGNQ